MNPMARMDSKPSRMGHVALSALMLVSMLALMAPLTSASAQTQIVTATPGYVNLGMTTTIAVTAPAAGSYTIVVQKPSGAESSLPFTPTAAGQTMTAVYGNASGFGGIVNLVGTYNVYLVQGTSVVGSTSFYATNKLLISFLMVTGGTCDYVSGVTRGLRMFAHIYVVYASNGATWNNNSAGWSVTVKTPDGKITAATWDAFSVAFEVGALPNWNYTYVGPWNPAINASDAAGNVGVYKYTGSPFTITPAQMATSVQLTDVKTGLPIAAIASGESVNIRATITYPTNAEPVTGFVAPLDTAARGGSVTAIIGWGYWNATANTFTNSTKNPGGVIGTVALTYSGANGIWTGQFAGATLPAIPAGTTYAVAVTSKDSASPPNTGLQLVSLSTASAPPGVATTTTVVSTSISSIISTTISTATTTISQTIQSIPTIVYAGLVVVLVLGLIIGLVVRTPRK